MLLMVPDRDKFTTIIFPTLTPNSTWLCVNASGLVWFTRDIGSKLVRTITKVFTNKFDAPYYSWTCVPRDRQERYFLKFADPLITGTVQQNFEEIFQSRMKGMVSNARTNRERPKWISDTLLKTMTEYWDTEESHQRSLTYSNARMYDRKGPGPHILQSRINKSNNKWGREIRKTDESW